MKRKISLLLITLLITFLVGCGAKEASPAPDTNSATEISDTIDAESEINSESISDTISEIDTESTTETISEIDTEIASSDEYGDFTFSTTDIDGNPVTEEILRDSKVVMINFWEPWCGPCVGEMPDLELLYENYKDQGLLIIGIFSTTDMEEDAKQILADCNISYPILYSEPNLVKYMTEYVPTSFFVDGNGNLLSTEPIVGSQSYDDWENTIKSYLN